MGCVWRWCVVGLMKFYSNVMFKLVEKPMVHQTHHKFEVLRKVHHFRERLTKFGEFNEKPNFW